MVVQKQKYINFKISNIDETQFPYDNGSFSDAVANRKSKPKDNE